MFKMGISFFFEPMGGDSPPHCSLTTNQRTESVHHLIASCFDTEYKCENKKTIDKFNRCRSFRTCPHELVELTLTI